MREICLLIDRITCRYPISEYDFNLCSYILETLFAEGLVTRPRSRTFNNIECIRAKMNLHRNRGVVITVYRGYGNSGIKFDWSPRVINTETASRFARLVDSFLEGGYQQLIAHGVISYLEVAVDIAGARVEDYLITYPRIARSCLYYNPRDGSQTAYLGNRLSRRGYCMYDKKKQLKARHAYIKRGELLRLEFRCRQSMRYEDLVTLVNPFAMLEVSTLPDARMLDESEYWQDFLNRCDESGAQEALGFYGDHRKRQFKQRLRQTRPEWANFDAIWGAWPEVVREFEQAMTGTATSLD